uniref:Uncharacterized protein n=1 Tax=Pristionchus pacificus TaxID=54126 RepID=A0A2A6BCX7_PRIPA|eukprot:PDM63750.1 hypothetical protein PRIPAC_49723 [Pristionchus pacificus]
MLASDGENGLVCLGEGIELGTFQKGAMLTLTHFATYTKVSKLCLITPRVAEYGRLRDEEWEIARKSDMSIIES